MPLESPWAHARKKQTPHFSSTNNSLMMGQAGIATQPSCLKKNESPHSTAYVAGEYFPPSSARVTGFVLDPVK